MRKRPNFRYSVFAALFLFIQGLGANVAAQNSASVSTSAPRQQSVGAELGYQVHSLPLRGGSLLGPSITYQLLPESKIGSRLLFSPSDPSERRLALFWRFEWSRRYFVWLVEPHYSYLWQGQNSGQFSTTGIAVGFQYKINPDLLIGTTIGLERSGPFFPFGPVWDRPSLILGTTFQF